MDAPISALILLLFVVAGCELAAPRLRIAPPILLALAGMVVSLIPGLPAFAFDPKWILVGFLPPLLYADAFNTSWLDFRRWIRPILMLAVGLVAVTVIGVGLIAKWLLPEMPWAVCFILGAVVSPTDTVAAQAVLERLRVPRRAHAILGGESLVNDATGLVAVQLGVSVAATGMFEFTGVAIEFTRVAGLGVLIGVLVGVLFAAANKRVRETPVLFTLSLMSPYLAFLIAEEVHASGVLAVVVAGFIVAWRVHLIPAASRIPLYNAWDLLVFLLNGFCFVYIGLEAPRMLLRVFHDHALLTAGIGVALAVIVIRFAWCFPAAYLPLLLSPRLRAREGGYPSWQGVVLASWCGVRGAVSLAAALSLPETLADGKPLPGRDAVIACTLAVILGTLFLQGLTLKPLIRALGMRDEDSSADEERRAREGMLRAGIARLDAFCTDVSCPIGVFRLREAMVDQLEALEGDTASVRGRARARLDVSQDVERAIRDAETGELLSQRDRGIINDQLYRKLLLETDARRSTNAPTS